MTRPDIVVLGASAGGVEVISRIVAGFPREMRAAVLVVLHVSRGRSYLPEILTRLGTIPAVHPDDGERLQYGRIYVAPPDHHLTLEGNVVRVTHGPTENGVRPAVDPLFRSAARSFGRRVIGVVCSGSLDDGTAGLAAVKAGGGIAIVQDPDEATAPGMPRSALASVKVDHILPVAEIARLVAALVQEQVPAGQPSLPVEPLQAMESDRGVEPLALSQEDRPGRLAPLTCPECHGNLWEHESGGVLRFRCRVGHVYSAESMLAAQTDSVDRALWAALRALEERAALTRKLSLRAKERNHLRVAEAFEDRAAAAEGQASLVRQVLVDRSHTHVSPDPTADRQMPAVPELRTAPSES
jgi:two-component system chemotaxis response regulator CheB